MGILSNENCDPPADIKDRDLLILVKIGESKTIVAEVRSTRGEYVIANKLLSYAEAYRRGYRVYWDDNRPKPEIATDTSKADVLTLFDYAIERLTADTC